MSRITGVYKISNPENQIYIGRSRDISRREYEYRSGQDDYNRPIAQSIKYFGWQNHLFEIAHQLPNDVSNEMLHNYEEFYWQQYNECGFQMLNAMKPGKGLDKHTEETKRKISKAGMGRKPTLGMKFSDKTKKLISDAAKKMRIENPLLCTKKVYQYSVNGDFIKEWDSVTIAAKAMNRDKASISQVACGIRNCVTCAGFIWKYKKD